MAYIHPQPRSERPLHVLISGSRICFRGQPLHCCSYALSWLTIANVRICFARVILNSSYTLISPYLTCLVTVLPAVAITLLSSRRGSIIGTSGSMITTRQGMRRQDNVLFISTAPTVLTVLQLIVRHPQSWSCPSKSCIIINCSQQLLCMLLSLAVPLLEINLDSDSEPDSDSPHPSSATSPSGIFNPLR